MANNGDKNWNRPWSTEEIIANADNWSLAGDVALLNSIKSFADNVLTKTVSISDNVDQMLNNLNEVGLRLDIAQNNFQSLRNRQFIESRVYEDDETADIVEEVTPEVKESTDQEKLLVKHLNGGLNLIDKYFNKVEVSISDSEEESGDISYILQAKDLYADRPLPLLIGSEEWYKKRHVGLEDSSSESETDKVSEIYSDSDSADDLPKDLLKGSETSSELDLSSQTSENRPVANSTFNDSVKRPDVIESEDESQEQGSLPVKAPISNKSFAEQLAAKLGNVVSEREDIFTQVNRQPIQPPRKFPGDLFSDEPPPLDDFEDKMLPKSAYSGLFSGGQGLFDDHEEPFLGQQSQAASKSKAENESVVEDEPVPTSRHTSRTAAALPKSSKISKGLFDSGSESSDEDIFAVNRKQLSKQPFLQPFKTTAPLFDEEPPALDDDKKPSEEGKKKPIGGVSIFGKNDLLSDAILKKQNEGGSKDIVQVSVATSEEQLVQNKKINLFDDEIDTNVAAPAPTTKSKKISLFDDDDDLFKDDLFSNITPKTTPGLFDDIGSNSEDLFAANASSNTPKADLFGSIQAASNTTKKNVSLFDDDEDIFGQKSKETDEKSAQIGTADVAAENSINADVEREISDLRKVDSTKLSSKEHGGIREDTKGTEPRKQLIGAEKKLNRGLFDDVDEESEGDDFFKNIVVNKPLSKVGLFEDASNAGPDKPVPVTTPKPEPPQLQVTDTTPQASDSKSAANLFGCSPPPVEDDWDTKSDNFSDNDEQFSYRTGEHIAGSSLFDNEPPSLGPNESSGIVRDQNITRIDTDDSSFYPYASSSRRLSSDVFNEQQSQDSFFVTKSKDPSNAVPNLDIIPEITKSNVDITPSGDPEDFEDKSSLLNDTSVFQRDERAVPASTNKRISLFDDDYGQASDTEDLFSIKKSPKTNPKVHDDAPKPEVKQPETPKSSTSSPGKLKHNLKINVRALVPGYVPPKLKDIPKSQSLDLPKEQAVTSAAISTPDVSFSTADAVRNTPSSSLEKAVSFDDTLNNVEVLRSVTKDRARIPIKRRPSTRRGRQQAIGSSTVADNIRGETAGVGTRTDVGLRQAETEHAKTDLKTALIQSESLPEPQVSRVGGIFDDDEDSFSKSLAKEDKNRSILDNGSPSSSLNAQGVQIIAEKAQKGTETEHVKTDLETASIESESHPELQVSRIGSIFDDNVGFFAKSSAVGVKEKSVFDNSGPSSSLGIQGIEFSTEKAQDGTEIGFPKMDVKVPSAEAAMADVDISKMQDNVSKVNKSKSSIFDLDDSDEDLFGPTEVKKSKKENKSTVLSTKTGAKSLFGDSSSDEDLFAGGSSDSKKKVVRPVEKKTPKAQTLLKKLENIEADDDPLSSLLK